MKWQEIKSLDDLDAWLEGKTTPENIALVDKNLKLLYETYNEHGVSENDINVSLAISVNDRVIPLKEEGEQADHIYAVLLTAQGSELGIAFIPNMTEDRILGFAMIDDRTNTTPVTKN